MHSAVVSTCRKHSDY